ncbi:MAG: peptidoglycan DD-metalloendopeptidase family protein [Pseudomonadota bacterium]|nr:peptidoglycan DD-metalloendopeptidase family protein [Pseudomonadota bacterium]
MRRAFALLAVVLLLAGCAARRPAPVVDRLPVEVPLVVEAPKPAPPVEKPIPTHTVKRGETLVGIALQYGQDYRELAAWNNITNPNVLSVDQVLVVAPPAGSRPLTTPMTTPLVSPGPPIEARPMLNTPAAKVEPRGQKVPYTDRALAQLAGPEPGSPPVAPPPVVAEAPPRFAEPEKPAGTDREEVDWMWPAKGKVLSPFSETTKGIDIAGRKGAPVVAASAGRVVYAGAGLRGYGKLIIIKHSNTWLSAYAHNDNILVKEQQDVRKGQKIAEMGQTDADQVKLHFEVRREGKPIDPAKILPAM